MNLSDIRPEHFLGGGAVGVLGMVALSKLRKILFADSVDAAASSTFKAAMAHLEAENTRLREELKSQQAEIATLKTMIEELKATMNGHMDKASQQAVFDKLGREGHIERRQAGRGGVQTKPRVKIDPNSEEGFFEITKPMPLDFPKIETEKKK